MITSQFFLLSISFFVFASCASLNSGNDYSTGLKLKKSKLKKASIEFSKTKGDKQIHHYRASSLKKTFIKGQIVNKKEETVSFRVQSKTISTDKMNKTYMLEVSTLDKDGFVNLQDFSFPEVGKSIPYRMNRYGEVLNAGKYSPDSEYFVPNVFLPRTEVSVGDTWNDVVEYSLSQSGVPMRLDLTSILKAFVECGLYQCADIEISGSAQIISSDESINHDSELVGRYLVRIDTGDILWQRLRSGETMKVGENTIVVFFCMDGLMTSPVGQAPLKEKALNCKAKEGQALYVEPLKY